MSNRDVNSIEKIFPINRFITTFILITYNGKYRCNEENLLKAFVIILMAIQFLSCAIQAAAIFTSARGTISNPAPRRHLRWVLYIQTIVFVVELIWECVGLVWTFDPSLDCSSSHAILVVTRVILIWNVVMSIFAAIYMSLRMGLCRRIPKRFRYEKVSPSTSFGGRRLSKLSSDSLKRHIQRRKCQWMLQNVLCCFSLHERQRNVFQEVSATLAEAFGKFQGYVLSDILAGVFLLEMKQRNERVRQPRDMTCMYCSF